MTSDMKCPLFPGMREGFCLRENCKYYVNEQCTYQRDTKKGEYQQDRKEAERALLRSVKEKDVTL